MNLVVHPEAEAEANQAAKWYEGKQGGLGIAFLNELEDAFQRIEFHPDGHSLLESIEISESEFRRCLLRRFPYLVIFTIRGDEILIVAVAHAHRNPNYWTDRIP